MPMPDFQIQLDVAAIILICTTAVAFIYRKFLLPMYIGFKKLMLELESIEEMRNKILSIYNEMHPNGGSSIRDAINRIDKRLVQVEQKQNIYLLDAPQGIYETDSEGNCIGANRTYLRMTGRSEKEILGRGWVHMLSDSTRDKVTATWDDAVKHKMEFSMICEITTPDGITFTAQSTAIPMESPGTKEIIGWLGTLSRVAPTAKEIF